MEDYSDKDFSNKIFRDEKNLTIKFTEYYPIPGLRPRERVEGPDFRGSNLNNALIYNCDVEAWRMSEADLDGLRSALNSGRPRLPKDWLLIEGYFIGPGANLSPLSIDNSKLKTAISGASLENLRLDGVNLSESNLSHVSFASSSLSHSNFTSSTIHDVNFSGSDLSHADFTDCEIVNCSFDNANILNAIFTGSTLTSINGRKIHGRPICFPNNYLLHNGVIIGANTDLSNINIGLANLEKLDLSGVRSGGLRGEPRLPEGWKLTDGYLFGPSANLCGSAFRNIKLDGVNLQDADFEGSKFENCLIRNISGKPQGLDSRYIITAQTLIGPNMSLEGLDLTGYDLRHATLTGIRSGKTTGAPQLSQDWKLINGYLVGPGANLNGANFSDQVFANVNIKGTNLLDANLLGVRSQNVYGQPENLPSGWKVTGNTLLGPGACIEGADLSKSELEGISVLGLKGKPKALPRNWGFFSRYIIGPGADLSGLDLDGIDLTNAKLKRITSKDVSGKPVLPKDWHIRSGIIFGPEVKLTGFDLKDFKLQGLNLNSAQIMNCDLSNVDLSSTLLTSAQLSSTRMEGAKLNDSDLEDAEIVNCDLANVDLSSARLRNSIISSSNLAGAILRGADLQDADISDASLTGAQTAGIIGVPSKLPRGYVTLKSSIIGPGTIVNNWDLSDSVIDRIYLQDANLGGSNLEGAQWSSIQGEPSELPSDYFIYENTLFGPKAVVASNKYEDTSFVDLNFTGATFKSVNFYSGNFSKSVFQGTCFENTFFFNCNFEDINLTNSVFKNCEFEKCVFSDTDFSYAQLFGTQFITCGFNSSSFTDTSLIDVDLRECDLGDIDFSSCFFENVETQNVKTSHISAFPQDWQPPLDLGIGEDQRTFEIKLSPNYDLGGLHLKHATGLYGYSGLPVRGFPKSIPDDVLIDGNRLFSDFSLREEDISGANLEGKNLTAWKFYRVKSGRITGQAALPSGWRIVSGYLVGPTANLNFARLAAGDFSGLDLSDVTFRSADLSGANFTNCRLDRVDFSNAILNNAIFPTGFVPNRDS